MNYLVLLGILIVIAGFALKLDSILTIAVAAVVTALVGGLGIQGLLETLGKSFVSNRNMAIFIMVVLVTGTLERNGLKTAAARLIGRVRNATPGVIIALYGVMRLVFAAFNVSFGGVAGFVRPVIMPMALGAVEAQGNEPHPEHVEALKSMASAMENVSWFFGQMLFVGTSGALLVKATLGEMGYEVDLLRMASIELPVAIIAVAIAAVVFIARDSQLRKRYYGSGSTPAVAAAGAAGAVADTNQPGQEV